MTILPSAVCLFAVAVLVLAERRQWWLTIVVSKMVASSALIWTALVFDAGASVAGRWLLAGLLASWIGDALLLPTERDRWFQLGIAAFLVTHVCYIAALVQAHLGEVELIIALVAAGATALGVLRWLMPHLSGPYRVLVPGYVLVITLMLATALAVTMSGTTPAIAIGGIFFIASDCLVARDRFILRSFVNVAWGLPLYFIGQLLLAWGVSTNFAGP